jgi:hypothetical protein
VLVVVIPSISYGILKMVKTLAAEINKKDLLKFFVAFIHFGPTNSPCKWLLKRKEK